MEQSPSWEAHQWALQLVKKFPAFMEPESSSPYPQVPATCRSPTKDMSYGWNYLWSLTYVDPLSYDLLHLWVKPICFCVKTSHFCSFSAEVQATKTTPLPWSPYQIILRINDTSLQPGHGTSYVSSFLYELVLKTELVPIPKHRTLS
jgi:hypothetical protein